MPHDLAITFIECCCYIAPGLRCRKADLWRAYKDWTQLSQIMLLSRKLVQSRWASFFEQDQRHILGVELKTEEDWDFWDPESAQQIYLIYDGELTKIGLSQDPQTRLRSLQTGSGRVLSILASGPGGPDLEQKLHQRYASKHTVGEWFRLSPEDREKVKRELERKKG